MTPYTNHCIRRIERLGTLIAAQRDEVAQGFVDAAQALNVETEVPDTNAVVVLMWDLANAQLQNAQATELLYVGVGETHLHPLGDWMDAALRLLDWITYERFRLADVIGDEATDDVFPSTRIDLPFPAGPTSDPEQASLYARGVAQRLSSSEVTTLPFSGQSVDLASIANGFVVAANEVDRLRDLAESERAAPPLLEKRNTELSTGRRSTNGVFKIWNGMLLMSGSCLDALQVFADEELLAASIWARKPFATQ